ncbi:MAG: BMP family ABC transporter substrate-binding protein [Acidimicrobiia bacterium]
MRKRPNRLLAGLAILTLLAAACGDDDDSGTDATSGTDAAVETTAAAGSETTAAAAETTAAASDDTAAAGEDQALDTNGDGTVVFGIAAAGPADDGAYYQAVVDAAKTLSEENGFGEPIVVDNIQAADAATAIADLAQQDVDVIIVGASEIAEPLPQLVADYPEIFWYCNCGAGFPEDPGLAQSTDDGAEISYTAGYATGLLLQDAGGDAVSFIGCCDLGFEKQAYMSFELGLQAVDEAYTMTYVPTGDFPFDFDNTANATAALQTAVDNGADAVYPYLGGAHRPVVQAANEAGLITMSAGSSTVCGPDEELDYDIMVKFDGGDYVRAVIADIIDGSFKEGDTKAFKVGIDPEPGAVICDPTPEQQQAMDDVYAQIAAGDFAEQFGAIAAEAFAEG